MTMWMGSRHSFDVPCTVEIEQTSKTLHAHVVLDGDVQIRPGDEVRVHDAPTGVAFGERGVRMPADIRDTKSYHQRSSHYA